MKRIIAVACLLIANTYAHRADSHAPIGVMFDHTHDKGEKMVSLRHSKMTMKDIRKGPKLISDSDYKSGSNKMGRPEEMEGLMTSVGFMYGLGPKITAVIMLPYMEKSMKAQSVMNGAESEMKAKGLGDIKLSMLRGLDLGNTQLTFVLGLSFPTGPITIKDNDMRLGYPMQLGSGSYEAILGITGINYQNWGGFGAQAISKVPLNENDQDYKLGNYYETSLWTSYLIHDSVSASFRVMGSLRSATSGEDEEMHSMMSTVMDPQSMERHSLDYAIGVNFLLLNDHRLAFEYKRRLDGWSKTYVMDLEDQLILGWQKAF